MADDYQASQGEDKLESREPTSQDLVALARSLNSLEVASWVRPSCPLCLYAD
jgi:hypothetical protein